MIEGWQNTKTFLNFALSEQKKIEKYNKWRIINLSFMGLQLSMLRFLLQVRTIVQEKNEK